MSASFSMSVSPFFKMGANFNKSVSQYTSQSKSWPSFYCLPVSACQSAHFAKCQPTLTCHQVSIPVSPSHEQVFIMSASFSMSVSPFFKMGANFNKSAVQYASQSKTWAGFICASFSMSSQRIFQNFNMSASQYSSQFKSWESFHYVCQFQHVSDSSFCSMLASFNMSAS